MPTNSRNPRSISPTTVESTMTLARETLCRTIRIGEIVPGQ